MFNLSEYGKKESQHVRFIFVPGICLDEQKPDSIGAGWSAAVKRAGIRRGNPYHTRHTYAC